MCYPLNLHVKQQQHSSNAAAKLQQHSSNTAAKQRQHSSSSTAATQQQRSVCYSPDPCLGNAKILIAVRFFLNTTARND